MSDTRTIYLKNNNGTIYSSDPSNVGYEYLNISDFDSLNPSENSIFTSASNISLMYSSYDVKLVLTFISDYDNGRQARADWVATNQNSITQISVANTNNPDLIFSKQAKVKTIDFVENNYINGVQAELTLELAGRWQSSIRRTSATVYPYTGGTKTYTYQYGQQNPVPQTNSQGQVNKLFNTEFSPDLQGWDNELNTYYQSIDEPTKNGSTVIEASVPDGNAYLDLTQKIPIKPNTAVSFSVYRRFVPASNVTGNGGRVSIYFLDSNGKQLSGGGSLPYATNQNWKLETLTGLIAPADATQLLLDIYISGSGLYRLAQPMLVFAPTVGDYVQGIYEDLSTNTYKYGYQVITDEVQTDGYNGFIINIPSQTTPVNVTLTSPSGLSATLTTSQINVPLQISSDMIGYSLDNFDTFTLLNKGFPASKYWDNLLSVYSTIQTILNANKVTVSVASSTGSTIPFEFYLYKLQDLI